MKHIRSQLTLLSSWRGWSTPETLAKIAIAAIVLVVFGWLYFFRLGDFISLGPTEQSFASHASSLGGILHNPLNLGYKLLYGLTTSVTSQAAGNRLASVLAAAACIAIFFFICRRWYALPATAIATVLFAISGWTLQTGRFGAPLMYLTLGILSLVAAACWFKRSQESWPAFATLAIVGTLVSFSPGGIWFAAAVCIVLGKPLLAFLKQSAGKAVPLVIGLGALLAAAIVFSSLNDPSLVRAWLGLPADFPSILQIAKQLVMSVTFMTVRGPVLPEIWLAHTPVLDVASSVFLLLGAVLYARHLTNFRSRLILSLLIPALILVAFNGALALSLVLPVAYILVAGGVAYFIHEWTRVFPRNPIARAGAYALIVILIACVARYHTERYMVAWRYSPETIATYRQDGKDIKPQNLLQ